MNHQFLTERGASAPADRAHMTDAMILASSLTLETGFDHERAMPVEPSVVRAPLSARDSSWQALEELPAFRTDVQIEKPRTIITTNTSPDLPFDRTVDPYRGCEHGCVYCFARPTHAYMGLSAGLDFENKLFAKPDAPKLLEKELARARYKPRTVAIGTNTDPYQPIEKEWRVTRQILEVLAKCNHPVSIVTKSDMILRDLDLLTEMASKNLVRVALSITTLDRKMAAALEPRASTPVKRLEAVRTLSEAGIPTAVTMAPVIPGLNDHEIERILDSAEAAGAVEAGYVLLRLPLEVSPLFREWLLHHYPDRYRQVMSLVRSMRGGKDYDTQFTKRMKGAGPYAWQIARRFELATKRLGLIRRPPPLRDDLFVAPQNGGVQLSLF